MVLVSPRANPVVLVQEVVDIHHSTGAVTTYGFLVYNCLMSQQASDLLKKALNLPVAERAEPRAH
jgi:hypothetical protein